MSDLFMALLVIPAFAFGVVNRLLILAIWAFYTGLVRAKRDIRRSK